MSFKIIINLVIYIYTRRYFLISFKSIRSFLIRFSNLCWWYIDTMQKLTFINESYGFFFEYLFKAWWFFQLDLMAVVVTVDVTVVCFLSFFLWISFKVMIKKADLCLWPIRNPPWKVPVFLPFFEYLIKYDRQCSNYVDSGRNPLFLWKCGWKPLLFYFQYILKAWANFVIYVDKS